MCVVLFVDSYYGEWVGLKRGEGGIVRGLVVVFFS